MTTGGSKSPFPVYLYLFFAALAVYSVQDLLTTHNVGLANMDRSLVHLSIIAILSILALYFFFSFLRRPAISPIMLSMAAIFLWCVTVDLMQGGFVWLSAVRLGLAALWVLVYYFFRHYLLRNQRAIRHTGGFIALFFVFYSVAAVYAAQSIAAIQDRFAVVNMVYNVLVFLPWIFLVERRMVRNLGVVIVLFIVVFSMKRGAIIVFPLMIASALLVEARITRKHFSYFAKIIFAISIFLFGAHLANRYSEGYLTQRFTYEQLIEGSGRSDMYSSSVVEIRGRSALDLFIGSGTLSTLSFYGGSAHNDWIEFTFSYGLVGAILYLFFLVTLLKKLKSLIAVDSKLAAGYIAAVVYVIMVGMYGMIYFSHATLFVMAFFGLVDGTASLARLSQCSDHAELRLGEEP